MTDDDLRRLFEETRDDVADGGFARRVMVRIERRQRRRHRVLGVAAAAGALITVPALLRAHEFVLPFVSMPAHALGQVVGVIGLSAGVIAIWLLSLTAEG